MKNKADETKAWFRGLYAIQPGNTWELCYKWWIPRRENVQSLIQLKMSVVTANDRFKLHPNRRHWLCWQHKKIQNCLKMCQKFYIYLYAFLVYSSPKINIMFGTVCHKLYGLSLGVFKEQLKTYLFGHRQWRAPSGTTGVFLWSLHHL